MFHMPSPKTSVPYDHNSHSLSLEVFPIEVFSQWPENLSEHVFLMFHASPALLYSPSRAEHLVPTEHLIDQSDPNRLLIIR
jgi:hypothetical protein